MNELELLDEFEKEESIQSIHQQMKKMNGYDLKTCIQDVNVFRVLWSNDELIQYGIIFIAMVLLLILGNVQYINLESFIQCVLLGAPVVYVMFLILSGLREYESHTFELTSTLKYSFRTIVGLKMLCFCIMTVFINCVLIISFQKFVPLHLIFNLIMITSSFVFIFAVILLACIHSQPKLAFLPFFLWLVMGIIVSLNPWILNLIIGSSLVFGCCLFVLTLLLLLIETNHFIQSKGEFIYA